MSDTVTAARALWGVYAEIEQRVNGAQARVDEAEQQGDTDDVVHWRAIRMEASACLALVHAALVVHAPPARATEPTQADLDAWDVEHTPPVDVVLDGIVGGLALDPEHNS